MHIFIQLKSECCCGFAGLAPSSRSGAYCFNGRNCWLPFINVNLLQYTIKFFSYKADFIIFSSKSNLFLSWCSWKIAKLTLNNNHSLTLNLKHHKCLWYMLLSSLETYKAISCDIVPFLVLQYKSVCFQLLTFNVFYCGKHRILYKFTIF